VSITRRKAMAILAGALPATRSLRMFGQASEFVARAIRPLVSGLFTVPDEDLFEDLYRLEVSEGSHIEPSAAAGFRGPRWLLESDAGLEYLRTHDLKRHLDHATHLLWTTGGGGFVPEAVGCTSPAPAALATGRPAWRRGRFPGRGTPRGSRRAQDLLEDRPAAAAPLEKFKNFYPERRRASPLPDGSIVFGSGLLHG